MHGLRIAQRAFFGAALAGCSACAGSDLSDREAFVAGAIARSDETLLRSRPRLVESKYRTMAASTYDFFRGTLPIYLRDATDARQALGRTSMPWALEPVAALGDPHPENFGLLLAADGTLGFEPNDFDAADVWPALVDLRRMLVGLALAVRSSNDGAGDAHEAARAAMGDIVRRAALSYVASVTAWADGEAFARIADDRGSDVLKDLRRRGERDIASREELDELTRLDTASGTRRFWRGVDGADSLHELRDVPANVERALDGAIDEYVRSLESPPSAWFFRRLDAVRELGSGVASLPRVRLLVLVRGESDSPDDDVVLEVKELPDSGAFATLLPGRYADDVQSRIRLFSRTIWGSGNAAPLWGTSELLGFPVQVRIESEAQKSVRVERLRSDEGTPEALGRLGEILGELVARAHTRSVTTGRTESLARYASRLAASRDTFVEEQVRVAIEYAGVVERDREGFVRALAELGPRLGLPEDATDALRPSLNALLLEPTESTEESP